MTLLLSSENVLGYLVENKICDPSDKRLEVESKSGKNFNLLVRLGDEAAFLVKQERHNLQGETDGEFWNEQRLQQLLQAFPELDGLRALISAAIHFDPKYSIIVFEYLQDYFDLGDFYNSEATNLQNPEQRFPTTIAAELGNTLATLHRITFNQPQYENCLIHLNNREPVNAVPSILYGLERIGPQVFGMVQQESLNFFRLYQRYESLSCAIADLKNSWNPCCLTHQDLRFNNVLLHQDWNRALTPTKSLSDRVVRIIDWEKFGWGDPTHDLGTLIAHYLSLWLKSLVVHQGLDVATTLRMATVPIALVQPSLAALTQAYIHQFSEILSHRPDFLSRVVQFAGIVLIERIQIKLEYHDAFDNQDICALQVAKTLLCNPEQAMATVFGMSAADLMAHSTHLQKQETDEALSH